MGLAYVLNKKNHEAYTIMFYTIEKIKEANEFYEQHHLENVSQLKELKVQIENMEKLAIFVINTSFVKMHLNKQENIKDKEKKENKDKKIKYNPYLADLMFNENIILSKEFI